MKSCIVCGTEFALRARRTQKFCSRRCAATTNTGTRQRTRVPWQERFLKYVPAQSPTPDTCWEWSGSRDQHGYGRLYRGGSSGHIKAHRASYEIHHGPIPEGMAVRHDCDNPPCVNPHHLRLGTLRENTRDMLARGRHNAVTGAANGKTRIPDAAVVAIREAAAAGATYAELAARFNVRAKYAQAIVLGDRRQAAGGPIRSAS